MRDEYRRKQVVGFETPGETRVERIMPPKKSNGGGNKKKKALGVNRGFATVSVAKKEVILEVPIETPFSDTLEGSNELEASTNGAPINGGVVQDVEWSPEAMERHDLQVLMDSVRSASEKEISKTMKVRLLSISRTMINVLNQDYDSF